MKSPRQKPEYYYKLLISFLLALIGIAFAYHSAVTKESITTGVAIIFMFLSVILFPSKEGV